MSTVRNAAVVVAGLAMFVFQGPSPVAVAGPMPGDTHLSCAKVNEEGDCVASGSDDCTDPTAEGGCGGVQQEVIEPDIGGHDESQNG